MTRTFEQLFAIAKDMGMTDQSATEMANEHIARETENLPRYVRLVLNAAINGKIASAKVQKFLDSKFGWNAENVHRIFGLHVNRDRMGEWYIA